MSCRAVVALAVSLFLALDGSMPARGAGLPPAQEAAILQIRVLEGDGAVHALGSRSGRPVSVQIADETGKPVSGAAVSFRLPDDGPGGVFASGMRTEVVVTGADGRATVWGIQWNRTAGPLQVRVTTVKGQSRAGAVIPHYLSDAVTEKPFAGMPIAAGGRSRGKWFYAVLLVTAGVAAGGAAMGLSRYSKSSAPPTAAEALTAPTTQVGQPSLISIGKP
jgi:hypothetical protein